LAVGGAAALDTAAQAALGPLALIPGRGSYFKRLAAYLAAGAALMVLKAQPVLERALAKEMVEAAAASWLEAAVPLSAALSLKPVTREALEGEEGAAAKLLASLVPLVEKLAADPAASNSPALAELARRLKNQGYELKEAPNGPREPAILIWEDDLRDRYDTFGLVRPGEAVVVEESPVIKDGAVAAKGLVAKK
jgi:hypothetical protein